MSLLGNSQSEKHRCYGECYAQGQFHLAASNWHTQRTARPTKTPISTETIPAISALKVPALIPTSFVIFIRSQSLTNRTPRTLVGRYGDTVPTRCKLPPIHAGTPLSLAERAPLMRLWIRSQWRSFSIGRWASRTTAYPHRACRKHHIPYAPFASSQNVRKNQDSSLPSQSSQLTQPVLA
jgi:hypothetical protein